MRTLPILLVAALLTPLAVALPTPGLNGAATDAALGRIFPEALQTNDYVSYDEAVAGLKTLTERHPDRLEFIVIGESTGWTNRLTGAREPKPMFAVEVTNEKSPIPTKEKLTLAFFLSIHGNEKGGREGGLRVIEDLARGIGLAAEEADLIEMLDYQRLSFIFANADGWTHDDAEYRASDSPTPFHFTRENAHALDLNRQFPTSGYLYEGYTPLSESESRAMVNYSKSLTHVVAGADMHGMLQNTNLVRLLLKDGEKSQQRLFENERLAELYKERLNANTHYAGWQTLPALSGVCCGQVAEWAATFDAIGYSASGTAGAWIVQKHGLAAPGYTVEYAYNHLVTDSYYPGAGAALNDYHVEATRDIVSVFMRFAAEKVNLAVETHGTRIGVLSTPLLATNLDDDKATYKGWFTENEHDDAYDLEHRTFTATLNAYFDDLRSFVRTGDVSGVLDVHDDAARLVAGLGNYDAIVVPGSAVQRLTASQTSALRAWVEAGGNLVLTDEAITTLARMGIVEESAIASKLAYSGYTDIIDRSHPLTANLKGFPRQTYDPNPLGFGPRTSPVWFVDRAAWESAGGVTVGGVGKKGTGEAVVEDRSECRSDGPLVPLWQKRRAHEHAGEALVLPPIAAPLIVVQPASTLFERGVDCQELNAMNVGYLALGQGVIHVFGAFLPDPTEEANHPYGLDNHAVAANGNLLFLNMLGAEYVYTTPPAVEELGFARVLRGQAPASTASAPEDAGARVPLPGAALAVAAIAVAFALRRRR